MNDDTTEVKTFADAVAEVTNEYLRRLAVMSKAEKITQKALARRALGGSHRTLYMEILDVGHELLGFELRQEEADALHDAVYEALSEHL